MKKSIGFATLDSSLLGWLMERLKNAPPEAEGSKDLLQALSDLAEGNASSLMLELDENGEGGAAVTPDRITCADLTILPRARKVTRDGREISLTPKEFDILHFLAQNKGEVFTKEQIYQAVWEDEHLLDDSNIMAFIRKLRKKIEPNPDAPVYILTVWGIGYKFNDSI